MNANKAALTIVVLTDTGIERVMQGRAGMLFLVETFTDGAKAGERVAHVRDYRFKDQAKHFAIWSLGVGQYQIVCEADEDAAILYGEAIGKPLPETAAVQTIPHPEGVEAEGQLNKSGRQAPTVWALNTAEARKLGLSCKDGHSIRVTSWAEVPADQQLQPATAATPTAYAIKVYHDNGRSDTNRALLTAAELSTIETELAELQDLDRIERHDVDPSSALLTYAETMEWLTGYRKD